MRKLEDCNKYEPEIKRLTKSNSVVIDGRVVYIVKKDFRGKTLRMFVAYDNDSKVQLYAHHDKDTLIQFLLNKDMSVLGVSKNSLF